MVTIVHQAALVAHGGTFVTLVMHPDMQQGSRGESDP